MSWQAESTNTFRRGYKNLGSEIRRRVDDALLELLNAEDPTRLGLRKVGKWEGV